jgi:hypothetical protein
MSEVREQAENYLTQNRDAAAAGLPRPCFLCLCRYYRSIAGNPQERENLYQKGAYIKKKAVCMGFPNRRQSLSLARHRPGVLYCLVLSFVIFNLFQSYYRVPDYITLFSIIIT